jgi:hypothetical protein
MSSMSRAVRQKVIAAAAVAVLATGGAIAAVSATGQGNHRTRHAATGRARSRDLATAASYLGVSTSQLSRQLLTGRSLAQIAEASGQGHTAAGLIAALEATKKAKLAQTERNLPTRVATEVQRPGGPIGGARLSRAARLHALFTARRPLGDAAAAYLSTTPAVLERELAAGKTLAQLAAATPAKSEAGLVAALVAAERRLPAVAASIGAKSAQRQSRREKHLLRRAKRLTERRFAGARQAG